MAKISFKQGQMVKPPLDFGTVWRPKHGLDLYVVSFAFEDGKSQKILVNIDSDFKSFWDDPDGCLEDYENDNLIYIGKISGVVVEKT